MPFDDARRTAWHFIPLATHKGLQVKEMSRAAKKPMPCCKPP